MRFVSQALMLAAPMMLAGTASAQIIIAPPILVAPVPVAPNKPVEYVFGGAGQNFEWYQAPLVTTPGYRWPQHFIVCVRLPTDPPCSHATARANKLPGQISNGIYRNAQGVALGIGYIDTVPLPDTHLDQWVEWQVAGCTGPADSSCRFSPSTRMVASTMEVQALSISYLPNPGSDEVTFSGIAQNNGTRMTRPFDSLIESWQALTDPMTGRCAKDPNKVSGSPDLRLMYKNGVSVRVADLPKDPSTREFVVDLETVAALNEPLGSWASTWSTSPSAIPPRTVLPPDRNYGVVEGNTFRVPVDKRPIAFVTRLAADARGAIWEGNEADNMYAECKIVR